MHLIVDAPDDPGAIDDAISITLAELQVDKAIVDWAYVADPVTASGYSYPVPLVPPANKIEDYREEDLDLLYLGARTAHG